MEFGGLDDEDDFATDDLNEQSESPAIHIAATDEQDDTDPITRIEQTLSDLDGDYLDGGCSDGGFEPAGSIVPEAELTFCETNNPFEEDFEEEEVVTSKYNGTPSRIVVEQTQQPPAGATVAGVEPSKSAVPVESGEMKEFDGADEVSADEISADVISVDENLDQSSAGLPQFAVARKSQYNQLFAKLRRG